MGCPWQENFLLVTVDREERSITRGNRARFGSGGLRNCNRLCCVGSGIPNPPPPGSWSTHMEEAIKDGLENQEIGCVGAAWRALLRPLLLLLFIVGVLVVLLGHPGAQRMRAFPTCPLPHFFLRLQL